MDKQLELIAQARINRLKMVIQTIEQHFPGIHHQKEIAYRLGYTRSATLSEYLNWRNYKEEKLTSLLVQLKRAFHVNAAFVMEGTGPMFIIHRPTIINNINNDLKLLDIAITQKENEIARLNAELLKKGASAEELDRVKTIRLYEKTEGLSSQAAEEPAPPYGSSGQTPEEKKAVAPDNTNTSGKKPSKKAKKK